jgi:predicted DsbA family dithiol-disulfide isomerase/SAM-dependent methyltransferase/glutaredoxin
MELVDYTDLMELNPKAIAALSRAYTGDACFGAIGISNVPGYTSKRDAAFSAGIKLGLQDHESQVRAASPRYTYPGWIGRPGTEKHPLQSSFIHNLKEEVDQQLVDPFFGKNVWPDQDFHDIFSSLDQSMHYVAMQILKGCDVLVREELHRRGLVLEEHRLTLEQVGRQTPTCSARWILYDSGFGQVDDLLDQKADAPADHSTAIITMSPNHSTAIITVAGFASCPYHQKALTAAKSMVAAGKFSALDDKTMADRDTYNAWLVSDARPTFIEDRAQKHTSSPFVFIGSNFVGGCDDTIALQGGESQPEVANMRTASSSNSDGLASMRTASSSNGDGLASMRTSGVASPITVAVDNPDKVTAGDSVTAAVSTHFLPWHIDGNLLTLITNETYVVEETAYAMPEDELPKSKAPTPSLVFMNQAGDVVPSGLTPEIMGLQMGAFIQIYTGGILRAARHAVEKRPHLAGLARTSYIGIWYAPWDLICNPPAGISGAQAINHGWNSMMDESYVGVSMRNSFMRFRSHMAGLSTAIPITTPLEQVHFDAVCNQLPPLPLQSDSQQVVVDLITDLRCPYSFAAFRQLRAAAKAQDISLCFRLHPNFLDVNIPAGGIDLGEYLQQQVGWSLEYAFSAASSLYKIGEAAGIEFSKHRRVVPTMAAFCALAAVSMTGGDEAAVAEEISTRYFEQAHDISYWIVLEAAMIAAGASDTAIRLMKSPATLISVQERFNAIRQLVDSVPYIMLRNASTGAGQALVGSHPQAEFERILKQLVLPTASIVEPQEPHSLLRSPGCVVNGHRGQQLFLSHGLPSSCASMHMYAKRGYVGEEWPYNAGSFTRIDETDDSSMYANPRFTLHIDQWAAQAVSEFYRTIFTPMQNEFTVLDMCSSWTCHYPPSAVKSAKISLMGLNEPELAANRLGFEYKLQDLNKTVQVPWESESFDFVTMLCSVDYLTQPRQVFEEMYRVLRPGGMAVIGFSNRYFANKVVAHWAQAEADGTAMVEIVCNYFHFSGNWHCIQSLDISPKQPGADPMWMVTAVRPWN